MSDIIICNEPIRLILIKENGMRTIVPESNECKIGIGQNFQEENNIKIKGLSFVAFV